MSMSVVNSMLSALKACQNDIGTGMDIVTEVALDLVETEGNEEDIKELEEMMLDSAKLDREINCFVEAVEQMTAQARQQPPEAMFTLKNQVKEHFARLQERFSDSDLHRHSKVVSFNESVRNSRTQANPSATENREEDLDEDIQVTQSQVNFTCPLTQVEMVNPVKNKKCNHYYDYEAVLGMIRSKVIQKKNLRCPVVGCGNTNVKESDLVKDAAMKRMIQNKSGMKK
ncbi:E3 SUMO-protein ligase NSE2 [Conger conger]|nr:E3 SUMO-protein ligase NSE2 [Conger conger]